MKPPTSNSSLDLLHFLLVTLLLSPSLVHPFALPSGTLPSARLLNNIFRTLSCLCSLACSGSSTSVPDGTVHNPNTFCTKASPFGYTLRTVSCPLKCALSSYFSLWLESFTSRLGPSHVPGNSIFFPHLPHLMHRIPCDAFFSFQFLSTKLYFSLGFGSSSSQSCHFSGRQ